MPADGRHVTRTRAATCAAVASIAAAASGGTGVILHVDDDAPPGGDGLSWDTAFRHLQDALATAAGGSVTGIEVAQGVYAPDLDEAGNVTPGDRAATFALVGGVPLLGGFAGIGTPDPAERSVGLFETVLSGDLLADDGEGFTNRADNSFHVATAIGVGSNTTIDGVTIQGGNADGEPGDPNSYGGGL
jgi:hypothetical protein